MTLKQRRNRKAVLATIRAKKIRALALVQVPLIIAQHSVAVSKIMATPIHIPAHWPAGGVASGLESCELKLKMDSVVDPYLMHPRGAFLSIALEVRKAAIAGQILAVGIQMVKANAAVPTIAQERARQMQLIKDRAAKGHHRPVSKTAIRQQLSDFSGY